MLAAGTCVLHCLVKKPRPEYQPSVHDQLFVGTFRDLECREVLLSRSIAVPHAD
jgi:hypothetical protein